MKSKFETSFKSEEIPQFKFDTIGQDNWEEVERWLHYNSPIFNHASRLALHCNLSDEQRMRLAVASLARQNFELQNILIRQAENSVSPIIIPRINLKPIPIYKKIWHLILTGQRI